MLAVGGSLLFSYLVTLALGPQLPRFTIIMGWESVLDGLSSRPYRVASVIAGENVLTHGLLLFPFLLVALVELLRPARKKEADTSATVVHSWEEAKDVLIVLAPTSLALQALFWFPVVFFNIQWRSLLLVWAIGSYHLPQVADWLFVVRYGYLCTAPLSVLLGISSVIALCYGFTKSRSRRLIGSLMAAVLLPLVGSVALNGSSLVPEQMAFLAWIRVAFWYLGVGACTVIAFHGRHLFMNDSA